jgi:hypothetical protein
MRRKADMEERTSQKEDQQREKGRKRNQNDIRYRRNQNNGLLKQPVGRSVNL